MGWSRLSSEEQATKFIYFHIYLTIHLFITHSFKTKYQVVQVGFEISMEPRMISFFYILSSRILSVLYGMLVFMVLAINPSAWTFQVSSLLTEFHLQSSVLHTQLPLPILAWKQQCILYHKDSCDLVSMNIILKTSKEQNSFRTVLCLLL